MLRSRKQPILKKQYQPIPTPEVYTRRPRRIVEKSLKQGFNDAVVIKERANQGMMKLAILDHKDHSLLQKSLAHRS
jgi:hypothetical protein